MRPWVRGIFTAVLAGSGVFAAEKNAPPPEETQAILASVNAEPISLADILPLTRQEEYRIFVGYSGQERYEKVKAVRKQAVEQLINRKLAFADCQEQGLQLPAQALDSELDKVAERMGCRSRSEFSRMLREAGMTIDELRKELSENMTMQLMVHREMLLGVCVTPSDVYEYYKQHPDDGADPERVALSLILLKNNRQDHDELVKKLTAELKAHPERFAGLARQWSDGPARLQGGELGMIERRRLRREFSAAMPEIKVNCAVGPVETPDGTAFLMVTKHVPGRKKSFQERMPEIRNLLETKQRSAAADRYFRKLRSKAVIRRFF